MSRFGPRERRPARPAPASWGSPMNDLFSPTVARRAAPPRASMAEAAVLVYDLAVADHTAYAQDLGSLQDGIEQRELVVEIEIADLPPVYRTRAAALPLLRLQLPYGTPVPRSAQCRSCPARGGAEHHPHLLEHVTVVIASGLVEADRRVDAFRFQHVQCRSTRAQAKVGRAIMADPGAGPRIRSMSVSVSHTPWPSVVRGTSRPKRSMCSTAMRLLRRRA